MVRRFLNAVSAAFFVSWDSLFPNNKREERYEMGPISSPPDGQLPYEARPLPTGTDCNNVCGPWGSECSATIAISQAESSANSSVEWARASWPTNCPSI